jgi:hypothetical protein
VVKLLWQIPSIGPIRAAQLVALLQTPHRFRTKRQLWAYIGLALRTYTSGEYRFEGGQLKRSKKAVAIRGESQLQPRSEKYLQGRGYLGSQQQRTFPEFLRGMLGEGNETAPGASDLSTQDCRDHFADLEETSLFRR